MVVNPSGRSYRSTTNPRNVIIEFTRSIIDRVIERPDRVSIPEITQQALDRFGSDQTFMMNLAIMNVREIVQAAVREAIAETRRGPNPMRIVRDVIVTEQEHLSQGPALMQALALRWGRFREWNGTVHVLLPKMTKPDLLQAAKIRRTRANHELAYAIFEERLAARLPDDTTLLEDVVSYAEMDILYAQAQEDVRGGGNDGNGDGDSNGSLVPL